MNYVKSCLIITMLLGIGYSQCDANGDGDLDVLDVVIEVDCILTDCWEGGPVCEDIDGNVYETIQIGEQLWMAENLKVTHYQNGDEIPTNLDDSSWESANYGTVAVYDDQESNIDTYGRLYSWYAVVDNRGVCPENFHVPTDGEYILLTNYLGGNDIAGGKMKEAGFEHWYIPNTGATNESGFTGLPGGFRNTTGSYVYMGEGGYFRSSSEYNSYRAWFHSLYYGNSVVYRGFNMNKHSGLSVRCIRDETDTILVPYSTGWNLVGLPLDVEDSNYLTIFPDAIENTLYSFDDAYTSDSIMILGEGYWLRFESAGNTTITGNTINELTISLNEGWNLISGISTPLNISDIQDPDGIIISGTVYEFTPGGYSNAEILEPGKGYWIRANNSGNIILTSE